MVGEHDFMGELQNYVGKFVVVSVEQYETKE